MIQQDRHGVSQRRCGGVERGEGAQPLGLAAPLHAGGQAPQELIEHVQRVVDGPALAHVGEGDERGGPALGRELGQVAGSGGQSYLLSGRRFVNAVAEDAKTSRIVRIATARG